MSTNYNGGGGDGGDSFPNSPASKQRSLTLRIDDIPFTELYIWEDSIRSSVKDDPALREIVSTMRRRSLVRKDSSFGCATVTLTTRLPGNEVCARLKQATENCEYIYDFSADFYGITPLYTSEDLNKIGADIIAVPGLGCNALGSWKSRINDDVWLRDYLPKDVPNIRVLLYGYDTTLPDSDSKQSIEDLGGAFLETINAFRAADGTSRRPIIFLGHSLGGLLIKEALTQANSKPCDANLLLSKSCYGLLFFGVPNLGLRNEQLRALVRGQPNQSLIDHLLVDNDSEPSAFLKRIKGQFSQVCQGQYQVVTFFERKYSPTVELHLDNTWKRTGPKCLMVTEASATGMGLVVAAQEDNVAINADHSGLVKFESRSQGSYPAVRERIKKLVKDAKYQVEKRFQNRGKLEQRKRRNSYHFSVPFSAESHFVGRETTLSWLEAKLFTEKEHKRIAVYGLAGTGKSQLAVQLAYWVQNNTSECSVFWLPALSAETFKKACTDIVLELGIPVGRNEDVMSKFRHYLENTGPWLLIVDNADDNTSLFGSKEQWTIADYFPHSDMGRILLTTCSKDIATTFAGHGTIELKELGLEESKTMLSQQLPKDALDQGDVVSTQLVQELDCLPLAIRQAAAYMHRNNVSVRDYLALLRRTDEDRMGLLGQGVSDGTRYRSLPKSVAATFEVSFERIRQSDNGAVSLLSLISTIEPKAIPQSLLLRQGQEAELRQSIGTLCGYAFLSRRTDGTTFDMPGLVHQAIKVWIKNQGLKPQSREVLARLATVSASADGAFWRQILPHVVSALKGSSETKYLDHGSSGVASSWFGSIWLFFLRQRSKLVFQLMDSVVQKRQLSRGEDRPSVFGSGIESRDEIKQALELLESVMSTHVRVLSKTNPSRLAFEHVLASTYRADGQLHKAADLLQNVVQLRQQKLASNDPQLLASRHELARVYLHCGQNRKALEEQEIVVQQYRDDSVGPVPDRLAADHQLAVGYYKTGQVTKAIGILRMVVSFKEKTLGKNDASLLISKDALQEVCQG